MEYAAFAERVADVEEESTVRPITAAVADLLSVADEDLERVERPTGDSQAERAWQFTGPHD